jgi:hypothetical protein
VIVEAGNGGTAVAATPVIVSLGANTAITLNDLTP